MKTADGSPRRRAIVSSSEVVLRTAPSMWSTRTRTSAMCVSPTSICSGAQTVRVLRLFGSDELLCGQELGKLRAAVTLIGDDLALRAGRALGEGLDCGPGPGQAHQLGVDAQV